MSYKDKVQKILDVIGGEKNVNRVTHCVTRLRLELKDENLVNDDDMKKIPGVIGIMKKNGQYQIILGNDVANYYKEFVKLGNFESDSVVQGHKGNILERIIEYIAGSMTPIIPAMLGRYAESLGNYFTNAWYIAIRFSDYCFFDILGMRHIISYRCY